MKITIKTLQQKVFQVDAEGEDKVADVKQRIEDAHGHPVANQKLIYSGKVLPDDKTVEACEIREKDFLVLMVSKPKATPASSSTTPAQPVKPTEPTQPTQPIQPTATEPTPDPVEPTTEQPTPPSTTSDNSGLLTGPALTQAINNIVDMGFSREAVQMAMRASFNNADRAVEYLMNGIPAHIQAELAPPPPAQPQPQQPAVTPAPVQQPAQQPAQQTAPANLFQLAQQQQQQRQQNPGIFGGGGGGMPQLGQTNQIRQLMAEHPEAVQGLLQHLSTRNPEALEQFENNPEELIRSVLQSAGEMEDNEQVVHVTSEERAAIERLEALGFPRHLAIEAYLVCGKNEELAANYLLELQHERSDQFDH